MVDTTAHPVPHMPKLKYRIPLPAHGMSLSSSPSPNIHDVELQPTHNVYGTPPTASSSTPSLNTTSSSDTASSKSPSLASTSSSTASSHESRLKKKMKSSSVFGFLSLKEPSQLALEQFAEQQRKQSAKTSSSSSAIGGFTGQKLPANVPKVNSKWDGVPDKLKNRSSSASQTSKDRSSVCSQSTQGSQPVSASASEPKNLTSTNDARNLPNAIAPSVTSSSDIATHQDGPSLHSGPPSPASVSLPEASWYLTDGDEPVASGALPPRSPRADSFHASVAKPPPSPPEPEFDSGRASDEFSDIRSESPASSTDSVDTIARDTADALFNKLNHRPQRGLWTEDPSVVQLPTESIEDAVPESHDFLFNLQPTVEHHVDNSPANSPSVQHYSSTRPVQNFSRPMPSNSDLSSFPDPTGPSPYRKTPLTSGLPTLYELSLASTESFETIRDNSDAHSIAPSSIAPSELSTQWFDSPRERLGLGGRIRKNDILPWETTGEKPKKNRLAMFGRGSTRQ